MGNKDDPISSLDLKEFISSSNEMTDERIKINLSAPLLFCTALNFKEI